MSARARCPECGLRHTARTDGRCPRCGAAEADGGLAPSAAPPPERTSVTRPPASGSASRAGLSFGPGALGSAAERAPPGSGMGAGLEACESCGALAPTQHVTYRQNIGAIVLHFTRTVSARLCARCADSHFREKSIVTLLLGWWGIVSFVISPFILLANFAQHLRTTALDRAEARPDRSAALRRTLVGLAGLLALVACGLTVAIFASPSRGFTGPGVLASAGGAFLGVAAMVVALRRPLAPGAAVSSLLSVGLALPLLVLTSLLGLWQLLTGDRSPEEAAFHEASGRITAYRGQVAFGNTERARDAAQRVSEILAAVDSVARSGATADESSITGGRFLTHAELRRDTLAFLVHVPDLSDDPEETSALLRLAWIAAGDASTGLREDGDLEIAVALRGMLAYRGLAVGRAGAKQPDLSQTGALEIDLRRLYPFFAGPPALAPPSPGGADSPPPPAPRAPKGGAGR